MYSENIQIKCENVVTYVFLKCSHKICKNVVNENILVNNIEEKYMYLLQVDFKVSNKFLKDKMI